MFKNKDVPSIYVEDYRTLHHDIGLVQRSNGLWDLWFRQDPVSDNFKNEDYLDIINSLFITDKLVSYRINSNHTNAEINGNLIFNVF